MIEDSQERPRRHGRLWLAAALVALVLALIVVPPLIGISRYKNRITQLVSSALGRPVRLSGVELRLLPRPGFVLSDLTVEEDPAYGSEPVLHATSVEASIRFASLWRGKLQISRISVDEASLNLVRAGDGRWNLDSLFRNATAAGSAATRAVSHPYLEATNSRINIKNGLEKLPFSLLEADASMWQDSDGQWRIRLRGQPARTDVSLDLADTGIVRIEGTVRPAAQMNQMPLHVDADWRDAQLGQLSRLLLGSDEGWRGDLHGELHLDGTAASAQMQARLRATGVHREEFAPAAPLDFDASCAFLFHYTGRSAENLNCNSPIGDGRVRVTGNIPAAGQSPRLTLDLDRIPAQAALDLLRTVRSKVDASLQAAGSISGRLTYDPAAASPAPPPRGRPQAHAPASRALAGPLTGSLAVDDLRITGDALARPIEIARITLEPAPAQPAESTALTANVSIPAGGPAPLVLRARLATAGFHVGAHGPVSIARLREFAHIAGSASEPALAQLAGEPANVDLEAAGPWLPPVEATLSPGPAPHAGAVHASGTIVFHAANWKPAFLASALLVHQATLHLDSGAMRWDPIDFTYGPVKGSATIALPASCDDPAGCPPQFTAHFGALDAAEVQGALLGARESGTLLSSLLDRLKPSSAPAWPEADGTVQVDSLIAGVFTLSGIRAEMKLAGSGAEITSFDASAYGGKLDGAATFQFAAQPQYTIHAAFTAINPTPVGALLDMTWTGVALNGDGKLEMSGYTDKDMASSAKGTLNFDWRKGGVAGAEIPPALARFDKFDGEAAIADGAITIATDHVQRGGKSSTTHAEVSLAVPHKVTFAASKR